LYGTTGLFSSNTGSPEPQNKYGLSDPLPKIGSRHHRIVLESHDEYGNPIHLDKLSSDHFSKMASYSSRRHQDHSSRSIKMPLQTHDQNGILLKPLPNVNSKSIPFSAPTHDIHGLSLPLPVIGSGH